MRDYFEMGTTLANKSGLGQRVREKFQAAKRSVQIRIVTPLPEVEQRIPGWLRKYAEGKLKPGAATEEAFTVFLDPTTNTINIVDAWQVNTPTATFYLWDKVAWQLAARTHTVLTAWWSGMPIYVVDQKTAIRDMELVDEILSVYYELMLENGHDLAKLFQGA